VAEKASSVFKRAFPHKNTKGDGLSAEGLFRQAQCSVKVIVACFVKGCLRQTPSKMKVLVPAARGEGELLRLLKTTNVLAHSQRIF
jgi:hypothetical protein